MWLDLLCASLASYYIHYVNYLNYTQSIFLSTRNVTTCTVELQLSDPTVCVFQLVPMCAYFVFYRSAAAATIDFSVRLGAASIRERRLLGRHEFPSMTNGLFFAQNDRVR